MKLTFDYSLFGLEPRDLVVYEAMLKRPEASSIRTIAAEVGMNRGTTFEIIKKLVSLGMVAAYYKNSRKYYRAEPPARFKQYATDRHQALADQLTKIDQYVSGLEAAQLSSDDKLFGKVYEGEEEIAALLKDILITVGGSSDKSYRVISSAEVSNHLYSKFRNFTRQRIKLGIQVRVIAVGKGDKLADLAERKTLTSEKLPASYIIIYADKVAQIALTNLGSIRGQLVENSGVAHLQRLLFDKLWESL
jgi:HTH-type transcriptional regulator, sugar sensing transcriptional regulator